MEETRREWYGQWAGILLVGFACLGGNGFMGKKEMLPGWAWFAIAVAGGAIGFGIYTPKTVAGIFSGAITGALAYLGLYLYVDFRVARTGSSLFANIELILVEMVATAPGFLLFYWLTRERREPEGFDEDLDDSGS